MGLRNHLTTNTQRILELLQNKTQTAGAYSVRPPKNVKDAFDYLVEARGSNISTEITRLITEELHREIGMDPNDPLSAPRHTPIRIRQILLAHGLDLVDMPEALQPFGFQTFGDIITPERALDRISRRLIEHISTAYQVPPTWLLEGKGNLSLPLEDEGSLHDLISDLMVLLFEGRQPSILLLHTHEPRVRNTPKQVLVVIQYQNLTLTGQEKFTHHRIYGPYEVQPKPRVGKDQTDVLQKLLAFHEEARQRLRRPRLGTVFSREMRWEHYQQYREGKLHSTDLIEQASSSQFSAELKALPEHDFSAAHREVITQYLGLLQNLKTHSGMLDAKELEFSIRAVNNQLPENAWDERYSRVYLQDPQSQEFLMVFIDRWNVQKPGTYRPKTYRAITLLGEPALLQCTGASSQGLALVRQYPYPRVPFEDSWGRWYPTDFGWLEEAEHQVQRKLNPPQLRPLDPDEAEETDAP